MVESSILNSYLPTLLRYGLVMIGLGVIMFAVYKLQLWMGIKQEAAAGRTLVMPWLIGFLVFNVFTIGASLYLSFTEYNLFKAPEWVGMENYEALFELSYGQLESNEQRSSDVLPPRHEEIVRIETATGGIVLGAGQEDFWRSMRMTLTYAVLTVPFGLAASLGVAMLLNQNVRGLSIWRVLYYLPAILPAVATALLWRWMFSQTGLINAGLSPLFSLLGIAPPSWLTNPSLILPVFVIVSLWGVFGANSVILLAGLKGIPKELYEAVDIDGGGEWPKFRHVTIPMLSPALFYNLITSTIAALQVFEVAAFIETPTNSGTFMNWLIYQQAFTFREMGMASAMAWILMLIIIALTALVFRSSSAWVFYQGAREGAA